MSEDNDSPENRPSSLDIIGRVWSSLTSNEQTDSIDTPIQNELDSAERKENVEDFENKAPETSNVYENDEDSNEESQRGSLKLFSSIFSSFTSENANENSNADSTSSNEDSISLQNVERIPDETHNESEGESTDNPKQGSLSFISDILSSLTSAETTDETVVHPDELQTAQQNASESGFKQAESDNSSTTRDVEEQENFQSRMRSSSSALYTEPEKIDKEDLDYVTLVSS